MRIAILLQSPNHSTHNSCLPTYEVTDIWVHEDDVLVYLVIDGELIETTPLGATNYTYDAANRMTGVNGVTYTWDDNGNLVDDGTSTYTYDAAGSLIGITQGDVDYIYTYNGMGDRLQQSINGQIETYTLDLNTVIEQVLEDNNHSYLYGIKRIGEKSENEWIYYISDSMGSVRQLVESSTEILSTQTYEPFGEVLNSFGDFSTNYSFVGEWVDESGLQYLRSRYYSQNLGIFTSQDPFAGYIYRPVSLNGYNYAYGNPINIGDLMGMIL
jgi:RHS repeat-associated protein